MVTWHIVDDGVECLRVERNPTMTCTGSHLYKFYRLNSFFSQIGIIHHVSCPHAHQQNAVIERKHRHIVEVGLLSLLAHA
jgi:hypothetical protein